MNGLELRRVYAHPADVVFDAFTQPEALMAWFGPEGFETPEAEIDLRTGGRYRIVMRKIPDGPPMTVTGVYEEVIENRLLRFTWEWSGTPDERGGKTRVTVEFAGRGGETELILRHEGLPTEALRDDHNRGWSSALVKLGTYLPVLVKGAAK